MKKGKRILFILLILFGVFMFDRLLLTSHGGSPLSLITAYVKSHLIEVETGSLAVSISIPDQALDNTVPVTTTSQSGKSKSESVKIDCSEVGISTISAVVYNDEGLKIASSEPWDCKNPIGIISKVPAGSSRQVVILAKNSAGKIIYGGGKTDIFISPKVVNKVGEIALSSIPENMAFVLGGCFSMGMDRGIRSTKNINTNQTPAHRVCLDDFYMDIHEVTQTQYEKVMGENPSKFNDCPSCPVERVSWDAAKEYCEDSGKRLPTEAEWEYAARERGRHVYFGNGKDLIDSREVNFNGTNPHNRVLITNDDTFWGKPVLVGNFPPNELGLYQMSGNVKEWVVDWYDESYYGRSPEHNPKGPAKGEYRVVRGGSWKDYSQYAIVYYREYRPPDFTFGADSTTGFRCAVGRQSK